MASNWLTTESSTRSGWYWAVKLYCQTGENITRKTWLNLGKVAGTPFLPLGFVEFFGDSGQNVFGTAGFFDLAGYAMAYIVRDLLAELVEFFSGLAQADFGVSPNRQRFFLTPKSVFKPLPLTPTIYLGLQ